MASWLKNIHGHIQEFAQDVLNEAVVDNVDAEAELTVLKQKLIDAELRLSSEQVKIAQLEAKLIGLSDQANASEDSSENIKAKYKSILSLKEKEILNLKNENEKLKEELLVMEPLPDFKEKGNTSNSSIVQDLKNKLSKCKKELAEAKKIINSKDNRENMITKQELEDKIREMKELHNSEIAALMANHEENLKNFKNEYEEMLGNNSSINNDNKYEEKIHELEEKVKAFENQQFKIGDVTNDNEQIDSLEKDNENLSHRILELKKELDEKEKVIQDLSNDNEVQQTALEAMKKHLENVNKKSLDNAKELKDSLEKDLLGKEAENKKLLAEVQESVQAKHLIEEKMNKMKEIHTSELDDMNKRIQELLSRLESSEKIIGEATSKFDSEKNSEEMIEKKEYDILLEKYNNILLNYEQVQRVGAEENEKTNELHSRCDKLNASLLLFKANGQKQEEENKKLLQKLNDLSKEFDVLRNGLERTKEVHRVENLRWLEEKDDLLKKLESATKFNLKESEDEIAELKEKLKTAQEEVENLKRNRMSPINHAKDSDGESNNGWRRLGDDHHEIMSVKTGSEVESTEVNDIEGIVAAMNVELQEQKIINNDLQLKVIDLERIISEKDKEMNEKDETHNVEIEASNDELIKWKDLAEDLRAKYEEAKNYENELIERLNKFENNTEENSDLVAAKNDVENMKKRLSELEEEKMKILDNESELKQEVELLKEELEEMRRKNQGNQEGFKTEKEIIERNLSESMKKIIDLENFLAAKHQESQNYYNKIQELVQELSNKDEEIKRQEKLYEGLHTQMCYLEEEKCKYQSEVGRLKDHLMVIEEQTTADQIAAEDRETELRKRINELERIKSESTDFAAEFKDEFNRKINDLTTEIEMLKEHKNILENELLGKSGEIEAANVNLRTLQNALQDLTEDQLMETKKYKDQINLLEIEINKFHQTIDEMNMVKTTLESEKVGLNGIISELKKQLEDRNQDISDLEMQLQDIHNEREKQSNLSHRSVHSSHGDLGVYNAPSTYKIDDNTLRQLFLSYFLAEEDKKPEIAVLLSSILNYSLEDREKINMHAMALNNQKRGWIASILTSPNSSYSTTQSTTSTNTSLTEQFVRFLENESKIKKNSIAITEMSNELNETQLDMGF
ncbi:Thyroid receptor-interacting protein 11 [Strongyloides ratti]|uniref:Thyroid receptor-interacting protein 11 n=1 Tax=Strongyloides ratti TaxID=34506 RepID=A0A090LKK6_STRRB|nr:Thyroid receptor-interacting protein 11 [Strongyloides ratti]CEF68678.1 Thyroid receptor-interacting protein 11 [Strongyloides ratti]